MKFHSLFFYFFLVSTFFCFSQEKFEKEYRVKLNQVPEVARNFIEKCQFENTIKWYVEESQDGKTFEAKSKKYNHKYSIEFSENGQLLDVEKTVKFKNLPENIQAIINNGLSKFFKKYSVKKIQIQWSGSETFLLDKVLIRHSNMQFFEIVLKGKKENKYELFEVLINDKGEIIKELKFSTDNTNNLQF